MSGLVVFPQGYRQLSLFWPPEPAGQAPSLPSPLHTIALTQVLPHLLEVVQIIRHGVGEVHEDIQIHGTLQGLKHLEQKAALLARTQPDLQALGRHLAAVQGGVNLGVLCPREWGSLLEGPSGDLRGASQACHGAPWSSEPASLRHGKPSLPPRSRHLGDVKAALHDQYALSPAACGQKLRLGVAAPLLEQLARSRWTQGR